MSLVGNFISVFYAHIDSGLGNFPDRGGVAAIEPLHENRLKCEEGRYSV
jgi:hypothetical protein